MFDLIDKQKNEPLSEEDMTYEQAVKLINKEKEGNASKLYKVTLGWNIGKLYGWYDYLNSKIENTARVTNYLFNRYLYGKTFNDSVNDSLKHWFNYGQRSPLEKQLMVDIPYFSFPIRSIDNWIERLMDPSYLRVMSDIIDGVYGQYEDDDGRQSTYTNFQIANGWLPIGYGVGLRMGNGLFDIQVL